MKTLLISALAAMIVVVGTVFSSEPLGPTHMTVELQITEQRLVGLVPEGLRFDDISSGVFTDGLLAGTTFDGIDYLLVRRDGVAVIDARYFAVAPDGATIVMTLKGYAGVPTPGLFEAMLDPEFEPPDVAVPVHGAAWYQTMAPQYAFLNHTVYAVVGTVNMATGTVRAVKRPIAE
ncbi:MAG: DUF3237 family protein [Trueperaceae bacterium]